MSATIVESGRPPVVSLIEVTHRDEEHPMTETPKPNPIPATYRRVTPCLVVNRAADALTFYADVFGAVERMRMPGPGDTIAHAEIEIGDAVLIVEDADPTRGTTAPPADGLPGTPVFQ